MLYLTLSAWAGKAAVGNLKLHTEAMSTTTLTAEAAQNYRVEPVSDCGLLLVTVLRRKRGNAAIPAQVYAGAMNRNNLTIRSCCRRSTMARRSTSWASLS